MIGGNREIVNTSAPYRVNFVVTYVLAPFTSVTTAITLATPIMTPSSVSTVRSLFCHSDCNASLIASLNSIGSLDNCTQATRDLFLSAHGISRPVPAAHLVTYVLPTQDNPCDTVIVCWDCCPC